MKGITGTSMQGREYYKRPDKVKCNCKTCGHCKQYDKQNDRIYCGKWDEWKSDYKKKKLCRWFYTFEQKKSGSTCIIDGITMRFLNKNLHFHMYRRELPTGEWQYLGKVYANSENAALGKLLSGKQYSGLRNLVSDYEYKAEVHGEDIEKIETWGENNLPKIIWKKVQKDGTE